MASSRFQQICSKDIYHGLPVFPDSVNGLSAVVVGATGISGHHMLRVLCESPGRWSKIYAVSRRPPIGQWPSHVEHVSLDLLQSPETLAARMTERGLKADFAFFFAYIQPKPKDGGSLWGAVDELVEINTSLLRNFLEGLALSRSLPKRVLLQLGAKYYGIHLGPTAIPQEESDNRVLLEPNFYYPQEDYLQEFAQKHGIGWNTTRPSWIPGAVPDAAMNLIWPLAVYATVQKHLGRPLEFPSDLSAWETNQTLSSAQMNGYLAEWIALTDKAKDESFNASDDCPFTWGKFWPKLAARFNTRWTAPVDNNDNTARYTEVETPYNPPPRGFGPPGKSRFRFTLTEWAKQPHVQRAWWELAETHQLRDKTLGDIDRIFGFADAAIGQSYPVLFSSTKAKKFGFFGFVDSTESIFHVLQDFADLKMIPALP